MCHRLWVPGRGTSPAAADPDMSRLTRLLTQICRPTSLDCPARYHVGARNRVGKHPTPGTVGTQKVGYLGYLRTNTKTDFLLPQADITHSQERMADFAVSI